eukprot:CAMPEP_0113719936 /NCGR_PEP_ID=MMETSP0038_2-20120614/36153_1 /TAXON_ID=2898 /ORGANISM="Cryptomonas paramecium" /LENGTH=136 /DNA_ID=CAMNT_0000648487 /DNA_START=55 /DNA_END=462 /DNA_ORIENTATION=+ /assembly_acc=CAM_ASM_000170
MKKCSTCDEHNIKSYYCSKECQKSNWDEHKKLHKQWKDKRDSSEPKDAAKVYEEAKELEKKSEFEGASNKFKEAADLGHPMAQCRVARYLSCDRPGFTSNNEEIIRYFRLAADQGCEEAQAYLGSIVFSGDRSLSA